MAVRRAKDIQRQGVRLWACNISTSVYHQSSYQSICLFLSVHLSVTASFQEFWFTEPCAKVLVPSLLLSGQDGNYKSQVEVFGHQGCVLEDDTGPLASPSFSLLASQLQGEEDFSTPFLPRCVVSP